VSEPIEVTLRKVAAAQREMGLAIGPYELERAASELIAARARVAAAEAERDRLRERVRKKAEYVLAAEWWCKLCHAGGGSRHADLKHYDDCPCFAPAAGGGGGPGEGGER
jgi:hypothetical protein